MILQRCRKVWNLKQIRQPNGCNDNQMNISVKSNLSRERMDSFKLKNPIRKKIDNKSVDVLVNRYPLFEYTISILLFLFSVYLMVSLFGIKWGMPGFDKKIWWHFGIILLIFAFSLGIMFNSDCECLVVDCRRDLIIHEKSKFFCLFASHEQKKISQVVKVSTVETGASKKVSLHSRWYGTQISFIDCTNLTVICCISEENGNHYKQMIANAIKNLIVMNDHVFE